MFHRCVKFRNKFLHCCTREKRDQDKLKSQILKKKKKIRAEWLSVDRLNSQLVIMLTFYMIRELLCFNMKVVHLITYCKHKRQGFFLFARIN